MLALKKKITELLGYTAQNKTSIPFFCMNMNAFKVTLYVNVNTIKMMLTIVHHLWFKCKISGFENQ
jgi:hypothetical protein